MTNQEMNVVKKDGACGMWSHRHVVAG